MTWPSPQQLRLVCVQLTTVGRHPVTDIPNALLKSLNCWRHDAAPLSDWTTAAWHLWDRTDALNVGTAVHGQQCRIPPTNRVDTVQTLGHHQQWSVCFIHLRYDGLGTVVLSIRRQCRRRETVAVQKTLKSNLNTYCNSLDRNGRFDTGLQFFACVARVSSAETAIIIALLLVFCYVSRDRMTVLGQPLR